MDKVEFPGLLTVYWQLDTFTDFELDIVSELARRGSISLGNAIRYKRARDTSTTLRISTLSSPASTLTTLQIQPFFDLDGAEGHWFDVIGLPGARTGLAIGDATAFGHAAAVVASQLRSSMRALAILDMSPRETMTRLNEFAADLEVVFPSDLNSEAGWTRNKCLYIVHDPLEGNITSSSAGYELPRIFQAGAILQESSDHKGPSLGRRGQKYNEIRSPVKQGAFLALTESLSVHHRILLQRASETHVPGSASAFDEAVDSLKSLPRPTELLVLAHTRTINADYSTSWDFPRDIAIVATARALAEQQLDAWDLPEDVKFVTTLVISELVTNAIKHASGKITLRLILQNNLTCEVSDGSTTAPYVQNALADDEGGRGLFIVAQSVSRWGVRHKKSGKAIWTEQGLEP